ncbi:hypothetical protein [uncultured Tenacibaculum sp.]|uniref:hypothetical protein n=1 Tax=uncultured Tenacibaculum sp. TaxID=174713 RepID=UPI0026048EE4|nr:hypothetical protein [uncultured Tenacibaculum sp.]
MKKLTLLALLFFSIQIFISCSEEKLNLNIIEKPSIINSSQKTFTSIKINSKHNSNNLIEYGICWSLEPKPTINDYTFIEDKSKKNYITKIEGLLVNTTYYFRSFIKTQKDILYSEEKVFATLPFKNTIWKMLTIYPKNNYKINSEVEFYENNSAKFEELTDNGVRLYKTYGTWSLNGNTLTYIFNGNKPELNKCTYIYTGTLDEMTLSGTYKHVYLSPGTWNAVKL